MNLKWKDVLSGKVTSILPVVLLIALLAVIVTYVAPKLQSFAGAADTSGYLSNAKLLTEGELTARTRQIGELELSFAENKQLFQPLGFQVQDGRETMHPTYPFGLPLLIAMLSPLLGNVLAIEAVLLLVVALSIFGVYLLSRDMSLSPWWSLLAASIVGLSPMFLFMAMAPMTDALSLCQIVWCLHFARRVSLNRLYPVALGLLFSLHVLARPTNLLLVFPILLILYRQPKERRLALIALSGVPGMIFLLAINDALYGSPFVLGYENVGNLMKLEHFPMTVRHFLYWLCVLIFPLVAVCFGVSFFWWRKLGESLAILWVWAFPVSIFYSFYYHSHEAWWYLRFILPVFPSVAIGGCLVLKEISESTAARSWPLLRSFSLPALLLLMASLWGVFQTRELVHVGNRNNDTYVLWTDWAKDNLDGDAPIVCMQFSGNIFYYLDNPIARYDWMTDSDWSRIRSEFRRLQRPVYAALFSFEIDGTNPLETKVPGPWREVARLGQCTVFELPAVSLP